MHSRQARLPSQILFDVTDLLQDALLVGRGEPIS